MKIVCIGDSLTEGLGVEREKAWPSLLAQKANLEVINRGISGDTTTGMLGRFTYDVITYQPSHVIIMGGGNDLWWDAPVHTILSNVYSMVKQAVHYQITPIIGISTPFYLAGVDYQTVWEPVSGYEVLVEKKNQYLSDLIQLAQNQGWEYIDFHRRFIDDDYQVNPDYFLGTDGVHPNKRGHQVMAELAVQKLRSKVS